MGMHKAVFRNSSTLKISGIYRGRADANGAVQLGRLAHPAV
jgi:hypothetical protein